MTLKSQNFLVDRKGRKQAVILSVSDFEAIIQRVEDLEDALALKRSIKTSRGTISHSALVEKLRSRGRL